MTFIELTYTLKDNIQVFPDDPNFELKNISDNDEYNLFKLSGGLHTGTHIDAPYHYIENGKKVFEIDLNSLIGKISIFKLNYIDYNNSNANDNAIANDNGDTDSNNNDVFKNRLNKDISVKKEINLQDITIPDKIENIIVFNTGWSKFWGQNDYFTDNFYLSEEMAYFLIENGVKGIAIDGPSVDKYGESNIHKLLLKNDIWIVENLRNLDKLDKNNYEGFFIPMKINAEASFLRAFVKE
ncbi:MAG: cyclase family protein [Methanobrevibacter sp.]|jgi:kynurenine formamidase|nr:cyclase family protein [Methanobrevibacter sp.]